MNRSLSKGQKNKTNDYLGGFIKAGSENYLINEKVKGALINIPDKAPSLHFRNKLYYVQNFAASALLDQRNIGFQFLKNCGVG